MKSAGAGKYIIVTILVIVISVSVWLFMNKKTQVNSITGKKQRIILTPDQEVILGIECAPELVFKFGGLYADRVEQEKLKTIGEKLVSSTNVAKSPYQFDFHILADSRSTFAFALPGGQIFLTVGLLKQLRTDNEIAAMLSHEIGHVIARHASEKLLHGNFWQDTDDSLHVNEFSERYISKYLADFIRLHYSGDEEREADDLSVRYMQKAGFDPKAYLEMLETLDKLQEGKTQISEQHPTYAGRTEQLRIRVGKYKN